MMVKKNSLKIKQISCIAFSLLFFLGAAEAQYKTYTLGVKGDTLNAIKNDGTKTGKWVITVPALRGERGYVDEGKYVKGEKDGPWRRYSDRGDLLYIENYILGGKEGAQQYFTFIGNLVREESWKGYNPDAPYDTIAIYGTGSNEIIDYKIVKAAPYSVKNGEWKYYDMSTGQLLKTEHWVLNNLEIPGAPKPKEPDVVAARKEVPKTAQMLEWEKKNKGKKGAIREGKTGL